eukprot:FR743971.1.p1 GENE.FR743971.1~~FR743971.1.p1  ORF type:complete len:114 (+),score=20.60 FR743971.1:1-342(+)
MSASLAALDAAQQLLLLKLAHNYSDRFREIGVVVPDEKMGRVIGKAGKRIATIREHCPADVTQREESQNGERMIILKGDVVQMTYAMGQVITFLFDEGGGRDNSPMNTQSTNA